MRISDWSSDVCSSDLGGTGKSCVCGTGQAEARTCQDAAKPLRRKEKRRPRRAVVLVIVDAMSRQSAARIGGMLRSEEHTSELQSLMRISYAVFCLQNTTTKSPTLCNPPPSTQHHATPTTPPLP